MVESKKQADANAEAVLMTHQLQDMLDREEFSKALKYCSGRKYIELYMFKRIFKLILICVLFLNKSGLLKNNKQPFFNTIKAYCLMKLGKH